MKDADFLSEAKQLDLEVRPVGGVEVETLINDIYICIAGADREACVGGAPKYAATLSVRPSSGYGRLHGGQSSDTDVGNGDGRGAESAAGRFAE
jgi:hypothetical protein